MVVEGSWMCVPVGVPVCAWPVLQHDAGGLDAILSGGEVGCAEVVVDGRDDGMRIYFQGLSKAEKGAYTYNTQLPQLDTRLQWWPMKNLNRIIRSRVSVTPNRQSAFPLLLNGRHMGCRAD